MKNDLATLLAGERAVVADGAMGTMLISAGLEIGGCPELWNVEHADRVRAIHAAYVAAGAQIILTNSFGGSRVRLALHELAAHAGELNQKAAQAARAAADAAGHAVVVAGSIGPSGALLEPYGDLTFDDAVDAFAEQAAALVAGGADVLWIETMSDLNEVRAAVLGARRAAPGSPIAATLSFDTRGRTMMGVAPGLAATALAELGVAAFGANCGCGPEEMADIIRAMRAAAPEACLIAKANAGLPRLEGDRAVYDASPAELARHAERLRAAGARIIGGCCGTTPAHVEAITRALSA
jgi:5-methyltetrahydrofolate--homocysteine methyltransferase